LKADKEVFMMTIKPLSDHVVLQKEEPKETTKGGIILASSAQEKPVIATVIAVGPGNPDDAKKTEISVKVGDRVITNQYSGTEITLEGEKVSIVRLGDILAVVEE
jgi:chaperonin GroES